MLERRVNYDGDGVRGLTARERQIMQLVVDGYPSKNIGADLGIS